MLSKRLEQALANKQQALSYRTRSVCQPNGKYLRIGGKQYLNFSGNDYLAIASTRAVQSAWQSLDDCYLSGSTGSPLINGYHPAHQALEAQIADWLGFEKALLFSTGFAANSNVLKTLMNDKSGLILQDKLNHASLIDGGLAANAKSIRFAHNDLMQLEKKLTQQATEKLIVSEGIFSMDGDCAPVRDLVTLSQKYQSGLMIDDAHGLGVLGSEGKGSLQAQQVKPSDIDIYMATFGKALGSAGAIICGSKTLIDYLVNFSRSYIYSTAMSPLQAKLTGIAVNLVQKDQWRRDKLNENIDYFKRCLEVNGFANTGSESAIQPIIIGDNQTTLNLAEALKQRGIWLTAIRPPTVAKGTARLRITLSTALDKADINYLVTQLAQAHKAGDINA